MKDGQAASTQLAETLSTKLYGLSELVTSKRRVQQAIEYATLLDLPFAYSTNGHGIVDHDPTAFPSPGELNTRLRAHRGLSPRPRTAC